MKRLVYILLILLCLSGQTRGTVLTDSLLHQYSLVLEANESPEVYKCAVRMVNLIGHTQDTAIARKYLQKLRQFIRLSAAAGIHGDRRHRIKYIQIGIAKALFLCPAGRRQQDEAAQEQKQTSLTNS